MVGLQVFPALPRTAVRRDGGRPKARLSMAERCAERNGFRFAEAARAAASASSPASRRGIAAAVVCLLVSVGIGLAFPQIVRHLLDAAFVQTRLVACSTESRSD